MDLSIKTKAPRYSSAQWEAQKSNIERLYVLKDKPLKEVIQILDQEFGFQASEKQLKSRLPKWGFDVKNLKGDTMIQLARIKAKRRLQKKESSFRVFKKPVDDQKIERYLRRHDITENDLLAMASPERAPSPSYSVFTPRYSVRSPSPDSSSHSILLQSPTRGLNFQSLSIIDEQPECRPVTMVEDSSFQAYLDQPPMESFGSESFSIIEEPISDLSIIQDMMDQDSSSTSSIYDTEKFNVADNATLPITDALSGKQLQFAFSDNAIEREQLDERLWSLDEQTSDPEDMVEEEYGPPSTPAEASPSDIEQRGQRIARFHGSVAVRYLEKTMERARTRSRFAPDDRPPGISIWYCRICNEHYAADVFGCSCTIPPQSINRGAPNSLLNTESTCFHCGLYVSHPVPCPYQEVLCLNCWLHKYPGLESYFGMTGFGQDFISLSP